MRQGAQVIYETDDDNAPLPRWRPLTATRLEARNLQPENSGSWCNAYQYFTRKTIWPRGLDLRHLQEPRRNVIPAFVNSPVRQGLANGSPDVDAVWRLTQDRPFSFERQPPLALPPGMWCPFNSQNTWWSEEAFPLLYLPSFVSFRMTDIWRSFVAQRCLWAANAQVSFFSADVFQDRNEHDLLRDFEDEVPGYLSSGRIVAALQALDLPSGSAPSIVGANLYRCYAALEEIGVLPSRELALVTAWLEDCTRFRK